jgi:hypothetical protein
MMKDTRRQGGADGIDRLIDAYGGDFARWPAEARARALLTGQYLEARLAEARALERLIDKAPALDRDREAALADRIFAAALAERGAAAPAHADGTNVVAWRPKAAAPDPSAPERTSWRAAGLLAASLAAGVLIGASINPAPVAQEIAGALGLQGDLETMAFVLNYDGTGPAEEEVL